MSCATTRCTAARSCSGPRRQRAVELVQRPRRRQRLRALDLRALELAPQQLLEAPDLVARQRRRRRLAVDLAHRPAGLGAQPERAADALDVDAEHARALAAAPEGGDREPREVAHGRLVAVADRLEQLLAQVVEVDLLAAGDAVLVLVAGARRPSRTPCSIAAASAARKKKRSNTRSKTRRSSGDLASVAASASRNAGSSVQLDLAERAEGVEQLGGPDREPLRPQLLARTRRPRRGRLTTRAPPSRTPTRSATVSRSVRCLTMIDIVERKTSASMSSAPSSSSARAQSIDSAIEGGFLRSSSRTIWTTSTSRCATVSGSSGACRRTISSSCSVERVVEPQVQAAALERLGQLARVVGGQQHDRVRPRLDPAELGDRDLEVGQQLEQHRLELLVGLVDLVDQQHDRLGRGDRGHQRPREQELLAEDVVLHRVPAGALGLGLDAQQLLAVVPLVQRLGLVEPLVALQAHELAVEVPRQRLGQLGLADARGPLDQHRLAEPGGQERDQRRGLARQVPDAAADRRRRPRPRPVRRSWLRSLGTVECSPPVPLAAFDPSPVPFVVLMAAGFLLGGIGHLYKSKTLIAAGIGLIFMATLGLPLGIYLSDR